MKDSLEKLIEEFSACQSLEGKLKAAENIYSFAKNDKHAFKSALNHRKSCKSLLCDVVEYLKPDRIPRTQDKSDLSLKLHIISLKILQLANSLCPFVHSVAMSGGDIIDIIDLLMINNDSHDTCCKEILQLRSWDIHSIEQAKSVLLGQTFEAVCDEMKGSICDVELIHPDTGENIVLALADVCKMEECHLLDNLSKQNPTSDIVKVVHIETPQYVWVQDVGEEVDWIQQSISELIPVLEHAKVGERDVIVSLKRLNFRGEVLAWEASTARVRALDYGWQVEVPFVNIYKTEEHITDVPDLARLCRLINVNPPSRQGELQICVIRLLQTFTRTHVIVSKILESHMDPLLYLLKTSKNANIVCHILLLFSHLTYNGNSVEQCGRIFQEPVIKCVKKWFIYPEVLCQGLETLRNLVVSNNRNRENFMFSGGLEVAFRAYSSHTESDAAFEHVLHLLKVCLGDYKFHSEEYQSYSIADINIPSHTQNPKVTYAHLSNMSQYRIAPSETVSFLEDIVKHNLVLFAREVISFLNSTQGGSIYVGVTFHGLINGLRLNRARKDDYRTKIDMVLSKVIVDFKLTELPSQLFDCTFEHVKNSHQRSLPEDTAMYVIKVSVKPARVLCRLRDGEVNVFFERKSHGVTVITPNRLRQIVAGCLTNEIQQPFQKEQQIAETGAAAQQPHQNNTQQDYEAETQQLTEKDVPRKPVPIIRPSGPPPLVSIISLLNKHT